MVEYYKITEHMNTSLSVYKPGVRSIIKDNLKIRKIHLHHHIK